MVGKLSRLTDSFSGEDVKYFKSRNKDQRVCSHQNKSGTLAVIHIAILSLSPIYQHGCIHTSLVKLVVIREASCEWRHETRTRGYPRAPTIKVREPSNSNIHLGMIDDPPLSPHSFLKTFLGVYLTSTEELNTAILLTRKATQRNMGKSVHFKAMETWRLTPL